MLIGLRARMGSRLELLHWDGLFDGTYRSKSKSASGRGVRRAAYSRILICKATMDKGVGWFGKVRNIMVAHLNNNTANPKSGKPDGEK